jgi:hypothetical protein
MVPRMLACVTACMVPALAFPAEADKTSAAPSMPPFGFSGIEIYKLDQDVSRLRTHDVSGDGLTDLIVVNNTRATIDFFIQKKPDEIAASEAKPLEYDNINEIASDARFRKESLLTEKRVFDLVVEDLNADGHADLAYYGDPKELVVVQGSADGWSSTPRKFPIPEARAFGRGLSAGDLNGDGKPDLALLGGEKTYLFFQDENGKMLEPREVPNSEKTLSSLVAADVSGDGLRDLILAGGGLVEPIRLRLQGPNGLGPEVALETAGFRSLLIKDLTSDGRPEIAVVQAATGRLITFELEVKKTEDEMPLGKLHLFPQRPGDDTSQQGVVFGDVDRDGLTDILETSASSAQFQLYRQGPSGDILPPISFPALAGARGTRLADVDGDGKLDIVLVSQEEKAIGVTSWDEGRIGFPRSTPIEGKPSSSEAANLWGGPEAEVAVAVEEEGKQLIRFFGHDPAGRKLVARGRPLALEGAKDSPDRIIFFDADQDGRADLLAFFPYEPLRIYRGLPEDSGTGKPDDPASAPFPRFQDVTSRKDSGRGILQGSTPQSFATGDVDGDGKAEFFLAKKNFARALRLTAAGTIEVVDQFNARDPASEIVAAASADLTGDGQSEVVLLDKTRNQLWVLERKEKKNFQISREMKIPAFGYRGLAAADLNGDMRQDLFILGEDRFGIIHAGGKDYRLRRVAQYETELKNARLDLVAAGDLNSDGKIDIVVSDLAEHLLEILVKTPGSEKLERALRFKVFETQPGEGGNEGVREPRDIVLADVTGDGRTDIAILVHDRLIIYPQEE